MPISLSDVAHLYRRAGFGAPLATLQSKTSMTWSALVDELLDAVPSSDAAPADIVDTTVANNLRAPLLVRWWYQRMLTDPAPLREKLTLFWHGHFCTEYDKVRESKLMHAQNVLLRAQGLSNFRTLTKAVATDPAMLRYLDNDTNRLGAPQENFARELWELFMLGVGNYSETDVVESARAWTGHGLNAPRDTYEWQPWYHDGHSKTIFGSTGSFDGFDVIDLTLDGPKRAICTRFLATKLWRFYGADQTSCAAIDAIAANLDATDFDLRAALRTLFLHADFRGTIAKGGIVRSPVEFMVACMRHTATTIAEVDPKGVEDLAGQSLFDPPNVAGWKGHTAWLSPSSFAARGNFARRVADAATARDVLPGVESIPVASAVQAAFDQFALVEVSNETRSAIESWLASERLVRSGGAYERPNLMTLVMLSPEFQTA